MEKELNMPLPELLSPAGSIDSLYAAVEGGADAVYFGADSFNARMRAENFTEDKIEKAITLCRQYGVKTYITLNTRLMGDEVKEASEIAFHLWDLGADAFIIADLALAAEIKRKRPEIEIHASTQLSGHSSFDATALEKAGFSRMVCPREMSLEEIASLVKKSPVEIEMFIHGAHCVSFSGQCMMSYAMGGRSGNRGMCAQPCRLPFSIPGVKNSNPLSLRDMCLGGSIEDIIKTGVSSLKIEGRQKPPEYVYGVTRIYRRLLDERRNADAYEINGLSEIFSRGGFTDGYLKNRYKNMLGMRTLEDFHRGRDTVVFEGLKRKLFLDADLELKIGERAVLTVTDGKRNATVYGDTVTTEEGKSISREAAEANMSRLGNTAFVLGNFDFRADENAFYTLSGINRLRREAIQKIAERKTTTAEVHSIPISENMPTPEKRSCEKLKTAEFLSLSQIPERAEEYFDRIYIPLHEINRADGEKICVSMNPLMFDYDVENVREIFKNYRGKVLVHTLGQAKLVREMGLEPHGSFRLNMFNEKCAEVLLNYVDGVTVSPEVPLASLRQIKIPFSLTVYGRIPLMHTQRCMLSDGGASCMFGGNGGRKTKCARKKNGRAERVVCDGEYCLSQMTDRTKTNFPIVGMPDCSNIIFNSVPIYEADKMSSLDRLCIEAYHFMFTTETREECGRIISAYINKKAPDTDKIKRIR